MAAAFPDRQPDYNLNVNDEEVELFRHFEDGIIDEEEFVLLYRGIVSNLNQTKSTLPLLELSI